MKKNFVSIFLILFLLVSVTTFSQIIKGTYAIRNMQTGMLLRIKDANKSDGTPLVAYQPVNWKCVTWDFNHVDGQTYQLRNLFTGKTFQSKNEEPSAGVEMHQQLLINNQNNQEYEFISVDKNIYLIKLKSTDLYITPSDEKGTVNAPIILSKKPIVNFSNGHFTSKSLRYKTIRQKIKS